MDSRATTNRKEGVRFVVRLVIVVACWAGANMVAFTAIDAYEFRQACRKIGLAPEIASKFQTVSLNLSFQRFPTRNSVKYKLLMPDPNEEGKKYPVVLYLHGAGERGNDGLRPLRSVPAWLATNENRERFPCFIVVPQCPQGTWWNIVGRARVAGDELEIVFAILCDVLDTITEIDTDRVYLIGYSMGGYGTWEFAARHPDTLAAAIPIAGAGDPANADQLVELPIWAFHGRDDDVVDVIETRNMIEVIREAGGNPKYSELEGVGHGSMTPAIMDTDESLCWLFAQSHAHHHKCPFQ